MTAGDWTADPLAPQAQAAEVCCTDASCNECVMQEVVKKAGARELGAWVGFDYDALSDHAQGHYREICGAVMSAMSEALIATGAATPIERALGDA